MNFRALSPKGNSGIVIQNIPNLNLKKLEEGGPI